MKIWFTSDTHFGSERTLKLSKRPFKDTNEMDEVMINNWNKVVSKDDTVYHLGDFGEYETIEKLNGKIILLYGNYEVADGINSDYLKHIGFYDVIKDNTFSIWIDNKNKNYEFEKYHLSMSHYPTMVSNVSSVNSFNLFGHIHKLQMVKRHGLNAGIDCHNLFPIDLDTVLFYKNAIDNFYDDEVFNQ